MHAPIDLLEYIFDGTQSALYSEFEGWLKGSRRFTTFAGEYRTKIRAKLRNVRDNNAMADVRAELATAALLLRDERFTLEYEKYAASKQRGPDFTVTFKTHTLFNVEVRRMRSLELAEGNAEAHIGGLMAVLCDKVGQMPPSIINLLWLTAEREIPQAGLAGAVATLRQLAEEKAEDFFTRRGFESAADFQKRFRLLSGVVLYLPRGTALWLNPLARHGVPPEIALAIERLAGKVVEIGDS